MKYALIATMILLCNGFGDEVTKKLVDDIRKYKEEGNYFAAIEPTNELIIEQEKALLRSYASRANCFFRIGEFEKAEADFRRAMPASVDGLTEYWVGLCLMEQRKFDKAHEMFTSALRKLPDNAEKHKRYIYNVHCCISYYFITDDKNDAFIMFEALANEYPEEDMTKIISWARLNLENKEIKEMPIAFPKRVVE